MKTISSLLLALLLACCSGKLSAQQRHPPKALVDYDAYEALVKEVKAHRAQRLIDLPTFIKMSREKGVVILDTRSDGLYRQKHVKGAIHLNFSDFTQENLKALIADPDTKILIYCNNNFADDQVSFATKTVQPALISAGADPSIKPITLALNIPTYINLYGYGYRNVYELSELVSVFNKTLAFEGTDVKTP